MEYLSFPRMVHFNEQDPLKVIALKIFKVMRPIVVACGFDESINNMPEADAY
jgi:hypothetical protein